MDKVGGQRENKDKHDFSVIIEEVHSDDEGMDLSMESDSEESIASDMFVYNDEALILRDENTLKSPATLFAESIKQEVKTDDDSVHAFGEAYAQTFGSFDYAPSAPEMTDEEQFDYEQWLRETQLSKRRAYKQHDAWQERLTSIDEGELGFSPVVALNDLPEDVISYEFKQNVEHLRNHANNPETLRQFPALAQFIGCQRLPSQYRELEEYIPYTFRKNNAADTYNRWQQHKAAGFYDEVNEMIATTDSETKRKWGINIKPTQSVTANRMMIISDNNGAGTGKNFQIWGPGVRNIFVDQSRKEKSMLNRVQGSASDYAVGTDYEHVEDRFTIIRIAANEIGFCVSRDNSNRIFKLSPGRYFLRECEVAYVGKAKIATSNYCLQLEKSPVDDPVVNQTAERLQLVYVSPGKCAFVKDRDNTYVITESNEPYIFDKQRGEKFIGFRSLNSQLIQAQDNSYTIINQLQPGEYIIFRYQSQRIVWHYDPEKPENNNIQLPSAYYHFDGEVRNINQNAFSDEYLSVIPNKRTNTVVLQDGNGNTRFVEEATLNQPFVIRAPWRFKKVIQKSQSCYLDGAAKDGDLVARVQPTTNDWVAVVTQKGRLEFYPPTLDGSAYYFYQPLHTYIDIIDKTKNGEITYDIPGIGETSIVNITSGKLGACRIQNMHFFLNPSPLPYVFSSPNKFLHFIDSNEPYVNCGDLHRIYLKPDQRAVISKNGKPILLPSAKNSGAAEEKNGVYIYRSFTLEVYGPVNKTDHENKLGPVHYFKPEVGEVAYGYIDRKLVTWELGEHYVNNNENQWFGGFFETNVDPVIITNHPVVSKHNITSHIDIYVTYSITDAKKAISQFRNHELLHSFIQETTKSEILNLCAVRPPIGYTDIDFETSTQQNQNLKKDDPEQTVEDIETSFEKHVAQLFHDFGIDLSKMRITKWNLDPEFVTKLREIALKLQESRAKNEAALIELDLMKIENEKSLEKMQNSVEQQKLENQIKQQTLEQDKLKTIVEAQTKAEIQAAEQIAQFKASEAEATAKAQVRAAEAKADADAALAKRQGELQQELEAAQTATAVAQSDIDREKLRQEQVLIQQEIETQTMKAKSERELQRAVSEAQQQAQAKTAGKKAEAEAFLETAKLKREAATLEFEARKVMANSARQVAEQEIESEKLRGFANAEVQKAQAEAQYPGFSPEQRLQLEMSRQNLEIMMNFMQTSLANGVQVPGLLELNQGFLQAFMNQAQMSQSFSPGMVSVPWVSASQGNTNPLSNTPFNLFPQPNTQPRQQGGQEDEQAHMSYQ